MMVLWMIMVTMEMVVMILVLLLARMIVMMTWGCK